jgi:hypothetical protein
VRDSFVFFLDVVGMNKMKKYQINQLDKELLDHAVDMLRDLVQGPNGSGELKILQMGLASIIPQEIKDPEPTWVDERRI